ncbi:MAG: phosphatase PAP2 family protein [Gemmatimonadetes bacterium]|nr:phosphatase PAP2 family protein [Gemmatimonadota bacterium]
MTPLGDRQAADRSPDGSVAAAFGWTIVRQSLARPYRVPGSMILLCALIPFYILIPSFLPPTTRHVPALALDDVLPLVPSWAVVYGALYLFLILLPIVVVREDALVRRMFAAYLSIWITAYLFFFLIYPTAAPRPDRVSGAGFGLWGLRALYSADPPYNCFPSLHVAHSFVSALACSRVHRRLGTVALLAAVLVALSTLFTKQHYVVDVVAGVALALAAYGLFLRQASPDQVPELDRQVAPALAVWVGGVVGLGVGVSWLVYVVGGETSFTFGP